MFWIIDCQKSCLIYISTLTEDNQYSVREKNECLGYRNILEIDVVVHCRIWCHLSTSFNEAPLSIIWATYFFSLDFRCKCFFTFVLSIFIYLSLFWKKGFQISMSRAFCKIRTFEILRSAFVQKIRTFTFLQNRTCPKNQDFCLF